MAAAPPQYQQPTMASLAAALARHGSALDLTAVDPPSQVNETAPYAYHRRNSSFSSDASRDVVSEPRPAPASATWSGPLAKPSVAAPVSAQAALGALRVPTQQQQQQQPRQVPSPRSLLNSAYSNVSWFSAATPSSYYRSASSGHDEVDATPFDAPTPLAAAADWAEPWPHTHSPPPQPPDTTATTTTTTTTSAAVATRLSVGPRLSIAQSEASVSIPAVIATATTPTGHSPSHSSSLASAPLTTAGESVNALEAQFAVALQQVEICQRMNRKLESHNADLEVELQKLGSFVACLHERYQVSVQQSLSQLKVQCADLSAYVQLVLRDYHYGLKQTEKAITQLLTGDQHRARALMAVAPTLPPVSRVSLRTAAEPAPGPYRPGEWLAGLSMYAKGSPAHVLDTADAQDENEHDNNDNDDDEYDDGRNANSATEEEEVEDATERPSWRGALPLDSLVESPGETPQSRPSSRVRPPEWSRAVVPPGPRPSPQTRLEDLPPSDEEQDAPEQGDDDAVNDDHLNSSSQLPDVVPLKAYRSLQLNYAACQRQLLLAEGKYSVLRRDVDAQLAQLKDAHAARVETLTTELEALRARLGITNATKPLARWNALKAATPPASPSPPAAMVSGEEAEEPPRPRAAVVVMRAPDRCYQHSNSNSAMNTYSAQSSVVPVRQSYDNAYGTYDEDEDMDLDEEDEEEEDVLASETTATTSTRASVPDRRVQTYRPKPVRNGHAQSPQLQPHLQGRRGLALAAERLLQQAAEERRRSLTASTTPHPDGLNESHVSYSSASDVSSVHHRGEQIASRRAFRPDPAPTRPAERGMRRDDYPPSFSRPQAGPSVDPAVAACVAQGLWAEELLSRRRRERQQYTF